MPRSDAEYQSDALIRQNLRQASHRIDGRNSRLALRSMLRFCMSERFDKIPDVRDGLTREERIVLYVLHETQQERGDRNVPTAMLWGRVCEHLYISPEDLSAMLARMGARK
jgi:hypothetical protein